MSNRITVLACVATLAACAPARENATAGSDSIETLVVRFKKGAHRQFVRIAPRALVVDVNVPFELVLEDYGDFKGKVTMNGGGTRNLSWVGSGDEGAFRRLAELDAPWHLPRVDTAAAKAGIRLSNRAGYWSPEGPDSHLAVGMVVAVRDRKTPARAAALLFVKAVGPGTLTLWIVHSKTAAAQD